MQTNAEQRFSIQHRIERFLYAKPEQSLLDEKDAILQQHRLDTGASGFLYKGKFYGVRRERTPTKLSVGELSIRMDALLTRTRDLEMERTYVNSYIAAILNSSTHAGTYVALFPSVIHGTIRDVLQVDVAPVEVPEEEKARILRFNHKGEKFFKQRILKNAVMD
ncbi:hypothetical protein ACSIQ7_003256 [Acinetobacter baumannii]|nr:hypothetical protein [Acinetobacter baumannii]HCW3892822.1 hypothetical protein [Acinetobacter baumannii]